MICLDGCNGGSDSAPPNARSTITAVVTLSAAADGSAAAASRRAKATVLA